MFFSVKNHWDPSFTDNPRKMPVKRTFRKFLSILSLNLFAVPHRRACKTNPTPENSLPLKFTLFIHQHSRFITPFAVHLTTAFQVADLLKELGAKINWQSLRNS
jgi:hypothetical protein